MKNAHKHNSEVGDPAQPNPYPKINTGAMRSEAEKIQSEYPSKPLNHGKMRAEAESNNDQTKHINKPIQNLGGGPLKGEK